MDRRSDHGVEENQRDLTTVWERAWKRTSSEEHESSKGQDLRSKPEREVDFSFEEEACMERELIRKMKT